MIISEQAARLESDTRQFVIEDFDARSVTGPGVPENSLVRFASGYLAVLTGSQWGPFDVTIRLHDDTPHAVDSNAQDVVELSVGVAHGLVLGEVPNTEPVYIVERGGEYRIRVSVTGRALGRSRDEDPDWDPDTEHPSVVERYVVDVWPEALSAAVVVAGCRELDRRSADLHFDDLPEFGPGIAATRTMATVLTQAAGGHTLTGSRADVSVERVVPWAPRRLFRTFAHNPGWVVPYMAGSTDDGSVTWVNPHPELLVAQGGYIQLDHRESQEPRRALTAWQWFAPLPGADRAYVGRAVPVLGEPTLYETSLERLEPDGDIDRCLARIRHRNLPAEWAASMRDYWNLHLAIVESWERLNTVEAHDRKAMLISGI